MAILSSQFPGKINYYIEESLFYKALIKIRDVLEALLSTSLFYNLFRKKSFVPDLYKESIAMRYIINPMYLWINSHIFFSRILLPIGLGLAICIMSFYNPVVSYTELAKFRLGLIFIPILLIAGTIRSERGFPKLTLFDLPLFSLFFVSILSLRTIGNIHSLFFGLKELLSLSIFIMSIYMVVYIFKNSEIKRLFYVLGLAGIGVSFIFILQIIFYKNADFYLKNTFGNLNHLGYFLVLVYPIALAISMDMKNSNRWKYFWFWRLGTILTVGAIFLARSLGVWISFFISFIVFFIAFKQKDILVQLGALIILIVVLFSFPFSRRIFLEQASIGYGSTIMARIEIWKEALASIYRRPILGVGLGQFSASAKPYYAKQIYSGFSVFFHLCATTGVLGLILFLWFLIRAFKVNISLLRIERIYGAGLLTSLTAGVIGFFWDTHLLAIMTNWLLGILWGSSLVLAEKQ